MTKSLTKPDRAPAPTESSYSFPPQTDALEAAMGRGRERRTTLPRSAFANFVPQDRDAIAILEEQNADRLPDLVPIRMGRMLQSPFAYYRGTAAVMANDLSIEPRTGLDVVISGDAHVSNFGLFGSPERRVLFDLNDFDEVAFGPWEWDVKRLVASTVIGGRDRAFRTDQCTDAARAAAAGYRLALQRLFQMTALERFYFQVETEWLETQLNATDQRVIRKTAKKARERTSDHVLAELATTDANGQPRIVDEFPVVRHDESLDIDQVHGLYDAYRRTVHTEVALVLQQFRLVDYVRRIVGVGSVGTRCGIALLVGPSDEPLFIQMKEAPPSVIETYGGLAGGATPRVSDNQLGREGWRVVAGQRILQAASDRFLGWVTFDGRDFSLRQFRDMKASVDLQTLTPSQYADYCRLCGILLARAHVQTPGAGFIAGYVGAKPRFDEALVAWAQGYADQVERDYDALAAAVAVGRVPAADG